MSADTTVLAGTKTSEGGLKLEYFLSQSYRNNDGQEVESKKLINTLEGDASFYGEIAELLGHYRVANWDGFSGANPPGVLDGYMGSFEAVMTDGSKIYAHGSNNFPADYWTVMNPLTDMVRYEKLVSTHFENKYYAIELPESWIGVMKVNHSAGLIAFETEVDGNTITALVIDDDDYYYYNDISYNTAKKAGVLKKNNEKDILITVREIHPLKNYYDKLTDEQKLICDTFDADRESITASITGINGYIFVPENGEKP